jgi:hypothetical protein
MGAKRLTDVDIEKAVRLLDGWTGKLTWERYLVVLQTEIGHLYTKPGIRKHARIVNAWEMAHKRLTESMRSVGVRSNGDAAIAHARQKILSLKAENERLKQENRDLLERYLRWSYNAASRGLSPDDLDREVVIMNVRFARDAKSKP